MKKSKAELEALGQGKRILELMAQKKIRSRSEFARIVGVSSSSINQIIWNNKEIRKDLLFKIAYAFKDLDPEWLLTGRKSELSTITPVVFNDSKVEEDAKSYINLQKLIEEKERYILSLEDRVAAQKQIISGLQKEIEELKRRDPIIKGARSG